MGAAYHDCHILPSDAASELLQSLQVVSIVHKEVVQHLPNLRVHRSRPAAGAT